MHVTSVERLGRGRRRTRFADGAGPAGYRDEPALPADPFERTALVCVALLRERGLEGDIEDSQVIARGGCPAVLAARRSDVIAAAQARYLARGGVMDQQQVAATTADATPQAGGLAAERLRSLVERIERLTEEKDALAGDIREVFAEAKGTGFDTKCIRQVIKLRKMEQDDRQEQEHILDLYKRALGMAL